MSIQRMPRAHAHLHPEWCKEGCQTDTKFSGSPVVSQFPATVCPAGDGGEGEAVVGPLRSTLKTNGLSWEYEQGGKLGSLGSQQRQGWRLPELDLRLCSINCQICLSHPSSLMTHDPSKWAVVGPSDPGH